MPSSPSILTRTYYRVKPFVPGRVRWALRRIRAKRILASGAADRWPIDEAAGATPDGWPGWPDDKKFAVVLTHDVESQVGLDKVRALAELEMELGFRSSFNFIPEGGYRVPDDLRHWLVENGFEVGVHDLHHDGKLYTSREGFLEKAERINHYLKEWEAVGFRSGFMLRQLDWLHDLEICYDCSTFDTDPFEPQPDGCGTIFPFVVTNGRSSYVELPYTLPQDSTLFLMLNETGVDIWKRKVEWIARKGGLALLNVHPDYLQFSGEDTGSSCFPVERYSEFLMKVKSQFAGQYWQALPQDAAKMVQEHKSSSVLREGDHTTTGIRAKRKRIWIDLENTPHIPFFNPIIRELKKRGYDVVITARDAYQTCEMADLYKLDYRRIGHHYGKHKLMKVWGLVVRSLQLFPFARSERPHLSLNHGSRTQSLTSQVLGIPTITIMDYEHTSSLSATSKQWRITPELVASNSNRSRHYAGIKEDVYVPDFRPDSALRQQLALDQADIIVTVRPPATEAHYHNPEAEVLFTHFMERACAMPGVKSILLPRNKRQEDEVRSHYPHWFADSKTVIPTGVVDGLNLLWHSDLVVSGGGTMNREAAAMGIPVYSIFRGTPGAVDLHLEKEGRLTMIATTDEVDTRIRLVTRPNKDAALDTEPRQALKDIINHIEHILNFHYSAESA